MKIFIPSRARATQANHTWDHLPGHFKERAKIVVHKSEAAEYLERFPKKNILAVDTSGIGNVRQHIIDISKGAVLMLDDDLSFFARRADDPTKLVKTTESGRSHMLCCVAELMENDGYAHVAIAVREGANRNTDELLFNTRCLRALGYNATILKKEKVRFDRLPVMEDFDVALQLLRKGYASATLNTFVQDQGTSNAPGGCSTYRTKDVQELGALGLERLHPDFVTVVQKETKGAWGGGVRTDVRIAWKKAYGND